MFYILNILNLPVGLVDFDNCVVLIDHNDQSDPVNHSR